MGKILNDVGVYPTNKKAETLEFLKEMERQRIRNLIVPSLKVKQAAILKECKSNMDTAVNNAKTSIDEIYKGIDSQMMGTMAKKVKEVVNQQKDKYSQMMSSQ